jgi:phenylalanyl-tRNA synthetase beta chain
LPRISPTCAEPSLIAGLIAAAQANADRGFSDVALFEVGQIFKGDKPEDQFMAASGVRRALASSKGIGRQWSGSFTVDALDAKADALAVLAAAGAPMQGLQIVSAKESKNFPPGCIPAAPARSRSARRMCSAISASCIRAHWKQLKADGPLVAFEVILERMPDAKAKPTRAKPLLELSAFQPVSRDFAFIVDRGVKASDIVRTAQAVDKQADHRRDRVRRL